MRDELMAILVVCVFIGFDILTGVLKAFAAGELNSKVMRKGMLHKASEILTVFGAALLEHGAEISNLINFDLPLLAGFATYICAMEAISIIENLCAVNPQLNALFAPYLKKLKKEIEEKDDSTDETDRDSES